jgi:hypothetical protein
LLLNGLIICSINTENNIKNKRDNFILSLESEDRYGHGEMLHKIKYQNSTEKKDRKQNTKTLQIKPGTR